MEDIAFLLLSDVDLDSSGSDSDISTSDPRQSDNSTTKQRKRNGTERLPTRRPDPNTNNRNALLARENRRKKKVYLQTIEKELQEARKTNRLLTKSLKKQKKIVQRLEREKKYFRSIIYNHIEIKNLVTSLNFQPSPIRSECSSIEQFVSSNNCSSYEQDSISINIEKSVNGSVTDMPYLSEASISSTSNFLNNFLTDYEPSTAYDDTWNELLEENCFGLCDSETSCSAAPLDCANQSDYAIVSDEHSYVKDLPSPNSIGSHDIKPTTDNNIAANNTADICLHIAGGKLSLEFCPNCHFNAGRTPPMQLLQN